MGNELSERQRAILEYISEFAGEHGYPPSVREIGQALHLSSSSTVQAHLEKLIQKGYLRRSGSKARALEPTEAAGHRGRNDRRVVELPLVGRVAAGTPILAQENIEDSVLMSADLVGGEGSFMLEVHGDSMTGDGLLDGDLVVVKPQRDAPNGTLVVARVGDEATVKRLYREGTKVRLQPSNPRYEPIYPTELSIEGVVVAMFRVMK
ncbi:MAG: transcriptional repressor LexA [Candidatus Dormibacteria bacterium]